MTGVCLLFIILNRGYRFASFTHVNSVDCSHLDLDVGHLAGTVFPGTEKQPILSVPSGYVGQMGRDVQRATDYQCSTIIHFLNIFCFWNFDYSDHSNRFKLQYWNLKQTRTLK